jgi:D-cysteine desulfhydrase family pyridoxal phosphate-dependent enzyme
MSAPSRLPRLEVLPRVSLAHLPTPLEPAPRLGRAIGLPNLRVKRDDATGLAMGGNKARKLEYLLADALQQGADLILTTGGSQSNHARMTAAAACRLGLEAMLFLADEPPARAQGNVLLDYLFGAQVRFVPGLDVHQMQAKMEQVAEEVRGAGRTPYIIPVGGSTPLGATAYVRAVEELAGQAREAGLRIDAITVAVGSTGTLAGIALGARLFLPATRVCGISVSPRSAAGRRKCARLAAEAAALLEVDAAPAADDLLLFDEWLGIDYGIPTREGMAAIRLAARTEGLLLDPVYTGKAVAGTIGLAQRGDLQPDEAVVFWHTGGSPALFAFDDVVMEIAQNPPVV